MRYFHSIALALVIFISCNGNTNSNKETESPIIEETANKPKELVINENAILTVHSDRIELHSKTMLSNILIGVWIENDLNTRLKKNLEFSDKVGDEYVYVLNYDDINAPGFGTYLETYDYHCVIWCNPTEVNLTKEEFDNTFELYKACLMAM